MKYYYELVKTDLGVPLKVTLHSVNKLQTHLHRHLEIILVLEGSVQVALESDKFFLKEDDLILINPNEVHRLERTHEDNTLLMLQIDPKYYERHFYGFRNKVFDCKSSLYGEENQEGFDFIRRTLAEIVWELNKAKLGHSFIIGSNLLLLGNHLLCNFQVRGSENRDPRSTDRDIERLKKVKEYIDYNFTKGIRLKDVAKIENLSPYHMSRLISDGLGITFQEYMNAIRLERAANLLKRTEKNITQVAHESGFPSSKALNSAFKKEFDCTPTEFRRENCNRVKDIYTLNPDQEQVESKSYFHVDRTAALAKLFKHLRARDRGPKEFISTDKKTVTVDATGKTRTYTPYWKNLIGFGRAAEGLRSGWQRQLRDLQEEIGFRHIRFHGIFSDDMMVYNEEDGKVLYNWSYVDELFDFFEQVEIRPFVGLNFMPREMAKSTETMFWWKANIAQPKDISHWTHMVKAFLRHCINRYGQREVESWYFEVWNEPELEDLFWIGGREDYFSFYEATARAVKEVSPRLKVGGPSITCQAKGDRGWLDDFLSYCSRRSVPLDFVSVHIYPEIFGDPDTLEMLKKEVHDLTDLMPGLKTMKRIYFDEDNTRDSLVKARKKIKRLTSHQPELHITEWNATAFGRNLINDTTFVSTFIIKNVLDSLGQADSLGFWTFTDIMEELKAGISHFHGGFGLINKEGIKKPSYYAYYLLSKLGPEILDQGEDYIITGKGEDLQVLAYNFSYFDQLFMQGDTSALTPTRRYEVYEAKSPISIEWKISNLKGKYKVTRYGLNREDGSAFDEWIKMGHPENMSQEEIRYLKGKAQPKVRVEFLQSSQDLQLHSHIPVHGVELILLEKQI